MQVETGQSARRKAAPSRWSFALRAAQVVLALYGTDVILAGGPARAADVEVTSDTTTVDLDTHSGSTAHVAAGVTVSNGVSATTQPWTLANDGTINGGNAVSLTAGGEVDNNATISATLSAITLGSDVTHTGVGTVVNAATITGGSAGDAVALYGGGTVTNLASGTISSTSGSNAVSLSGGTSRSVFNYGIISDTGGSFATGVLIQGGAGSITNYATGQIFGTYNGIYTSGSTPLTLTNAGLISSTNGPGVEAHGGGTFINSGTIQSGNDGLWISGAATVTNSGTIKSTGAGRAVVFSGSAVHTLDLDTGSVLGGNVQGGSGTDNLVLLGSGTESIAKFLSFETLSMQGSAWTMTGSGAFSTSSTVQSGTLNVAGQLTTPTLSVLAAGTLTGNGTVVGSVSNSGTVRVDSGVFTVNGNFVSNSGSAFNVGVTPASNGLLTIIGAGHTATLNGGAVAVSAASGLYALNTVYTILTATGGRNGTFDSVTSSLAFLAPSS